MRELFQRSCLESNLEASSSSFALLYIATNHTSADNRIKTIFWYEKYNLRSILPPYFKFAKTQAITLCKIWAIYFLILEICSTFHFHNCKDLLHFGNSCDLFYEKLSPAFCWVVNLFVANIASCCSFCEHNPTKEIIVNTIQQRK